MVAGTSTVYVHAEYVRQTNAQELLLLWGSRGLELESIICEATVLPKMSERWLHVPRPQPVALCGPQPPDLGKTASVVEYFLRYFGIATVMD